MWGLLADLALFHDAPSPLSLAGAVLVCGSSFLIVYFEQRSGGSGGSGGSGSSKEGGSTPAWAPLRAKQSTAAETPADVTPLWQQPAGSYGEQRLELAEGGSLSGGSRSGAASRADERAPLVAGSTQRSA